MKVFPILMALLLVPAVAVWSAGCDDAPADNGGNGGNGGDGGSGTGGTGGGTGGTGGGTGGNGGTGGTGGADCIDTGDPGCDPAIGGFGECCDYPDAFCDTTGTCVFL